MPAGLRILKHLDIVFLVCTLPIFIGADLPLLGWAGGTFAYVSQRLIGELLSYVRMETADPRPDREQIALKDALERLITKHAALYSSIRFEVSEDVGGEENTVVADRLGFERAMGNLLNNAGRHANSQVTVRAESNGGFVIVDVDGALVGGASLKADSFLKLVHFEKQ